jgi:hypothetical protein
VPVPERATFWRVPLALEEILRVPLRAPVAVGVKITLIVQFAPTATELPQLLLWERSLALTLVIAMLVILKAAWLAFVRVTVSGTLGVQTATYPKERLVAKRLTAGAMLAAGDPIVRAAEKMTSPAIATRRMAVFIRVCCTGPSWISDASMLRAPPVGGKESVRRQDRRVS